MTFLTLPSSYPLCFWEAGLTVENLRKRSSPKAGLATATKAVRAFLKADLFIIFGRRVHFFSLPSDGSLVPTEAFRPVSLC